MVYKSFRNNRAISRAHSHCEAHKNSVIDVIVKYAKEVGIVVILDNAMHNAQCDARPPHWESTVQC